MGSDRFTLARVHYDSIIQSRLTALKIPVPKYLATADLSSVSIVSPFPESHRGEIYGNFCSATLSMNNMPLRFLHVFSWLDSSRLFIADCVPLSEYTTAFICSPTEGHLGFFQYLAIMKTLLQTSVCRFLCGCRAFKRCFCLFVWLCV